MKIPFGLPAYSVCIKRIRRKQAAEDVSGKKRLKLSEIWGNCKKQKNKVQFFLENDIMETEDALRRP